MRNLILLGLSAYLAASVSFSIILFKVLGRGDPRDNFSGNAGTVNVTRQLGLIWGLLILMLDVGRAGVIAQVGMWFLPPPLVPLLGFILVVGNQRPLFHGFRGGKGGGQLSRIYCFYLPCCGRGFLLSLGLCLWAIPSALYRVFLYDHGLRIWDNNPLPLGLAGGYRRRFDNGSNLSSP